jgi:hypothetical protein
MVHSSVFKTTGDKVVYRQSSTYTTKIAKTTQIKKGGFSLKKLSVDRKEEIQT